VSDSAASPGQITARILLDEGPYRVREVAYPPDHRQDDHAHARAGLTLVMAGSLREAAGRCLQTAGPLSVVIKAPGVEHRDAYGPDGAHTLQVVFDPEEVLGPASADVRMPSWRWLHGAPAAEPLLALWRALRPASADEPERGESPEADERVLSALAAAAEDSPRTSDPPAWLEAARRALDESLAEGISVRELADDAGVHPVSLSRAFRRHYGRTVTEYRRRARVRRAAVRLRETGHDVSRIAFATGFADHAHLCRTFRETTGVTPTEFRRLSPDRS